jgi:GDPmannose 4,6-dehydratase
MTPRVALVTGVAGQDGSYLFERLAAEGTVVHGLLHPDHGLLEAPLAGSDALVTHRLDLADLDGLAGLVRDVAPDEIYNLGGISSVARSWEEPALTGVVSGVSAAALLDAALAVQEDTGRGVRFLQASSSEIFGQADRAPQDETFPLAPVSPYGAAKAYAHRMTGIYRARGLHAVAVILYTHESPRRPPSFVARKISTTVAEIARSGGGTLTLGNLAARRDWGWAPDYVDAMVRAVRHDVAEDFVLATGQTHSVADFVRTAFAHVGIEDWQAHTVSAPELIRPADAAEQCGDATRARDLLGWTPTTTFTDIVHAMVDHDLGTAG